MHFSASSCCSFSTQQGFTERPALSRVLRQLTVKFGDLSRRALISSVSSSRVLSSAQFASRGELQIFAQSSRFTFEYHSFRSGRIPRAASHRLCALPPAFQTNHRLGFFCSRARRVLLSTATGFLESLLEVVELADLSAGVSQQIAQDLVFLTHPRTDVGQAFHRDIIRAFRPSRLAPKVVRTYAAAPRPFRPKRSDSFAMTTPPQPQKRYDSPKRRNYVIISLWRWKHSQQQLLSSCASVRPLSAMAVNSVRVTRTVHRNVERSP